MRLSIISASGFQPSFFQAEISLLMLEMYNYWYIQVEYKFEYRESGLFAQNSRSLIRAYLTSSKYGTGAMSYTSRAGGLK